MELKQPTQNISIFAARVLASELFYRPLSTMSGPSCIFPELCDPDHDHYRSRHREIETGLVLLSAALPSSLRLPAAARDQNAIFVNVLLQTATICLHKTLLKHGTCAVCAVDDAVARRSRDRVVAAAHETIHVFSLAGDLPVALRNPTLCFAAYTAGLVCCEMAVRGGDANGLDNVRFLVNMLNAVGPTNVVAGMLAAQLAQHARSMGLGLAGVNMVCGPTLDVTSRRGTHLLLSSRQLRVEVLPMCRCCIASSSPGSWRRTSRGCRRPSRGMRAWCELMQSSQGYRLISLKPLRSYSFSESSAKKSASPESD